MRIFGGSAPGISFFRFIFICRKSNALITLYRRNLDSSAALLGLEVDVMIVIGISDGIATAHTYVRRYRYY